MNSLPGVTLSCVTMQLTSLPTCPTSLPPRRSELSWVNLTTRKSSQNEQHGWDSVSQPRSPSSYAFLESPVHRLLMTWYETGTPSPMVLGRYLHFLQI